MFSSTSRPMPPRLRLTPSTHTLRGSSSGARDRRSATRSRRQVAAALVALGLTSIVMDRTSWSRCSVSSKPASWKTRSIGAFAASTSASNLETPRSSDQRARCSRSTVPMPCPCRFSSTSIATSAEPGASTAAVAMPTIRPPCSATSDQPVDEEVHTRSTNDSLADRFTQKNRR